jgi:hypothetical protein
MRCLIQKAQQLSRASQARVMPGLFLAAERVVEKKLEISAGNILAGWSRVSGKVGGWSDEWYVRWLELVG